ncbi:NAD binding domain of 6-phosphogluconate dehydrogenase-domain-containing protein [Xylaria sp. FL1042]|nr:NAD binding domain of 6-phosphogluconate dehydrogenase-domain-containing protein [Xylaria sp. FL1042]
MAIPAHSFGFIGLGNIGSQIAHNLSVYAQEKGYARVQIWNRSTTKSKQLADNCYCEVADSIQSFAEACNVIHMCLANDGAVHDVVNKILAVRKQGIILVDHSTLYPTTSKVLQEKAAQSGVIFCSCPVFGPPAAAKAATLLVAISGQEQAREVLIEYIVPTIGKAVIDCGEDTSQGALLKILGNNCILGTIELLSKSFALAEKTGFDVNRFYEFIQIWFPAPAWLNYGKKIRDGAFSGAMGFTIPGGMKDAGFIRRLGAETATPSPVIDQAWNHLTTAMALGGESLDWSACAAGMRVAAGLHPFKGEDFSLPKAATNSFTLQ